MKDQKADSDALSIGARVGELFLVAAMALLAGFFIAHQISRTGFFTAEFGWFGMICLYLPMLAAIVPPLIRVWKARRQPARPFDAAANLLLALGSLWLLIVFPLDYRHLPDALPGALRFALAWITDDIARVVILLQVITMPISAITHLVKFASSSGQRKIARPA